MITTRQGVIDGLMPSQALFRSNGGANGAGQVSSSWAVASQIPVGVGAFSVSLNGATLTGPGVSGQIPIIDPVAGERTYLARWAHRPRRTDIAVNMAGCLADRLWHNGGIDETLTSAQGITSPTWPSRDEEGQTAGKGVLLAVEIETVMGAAVPTITVSYTNSAGANGRTATNIMAAPSAAPAGVFMEMSLQAGDVGVKSVESITLSTSWLSGEMHLVAYRPLCTIMEVASQRLTVLDAITSNFPRIYDGSVLFTLGMNTSTSGPAGMSGEIQFTQG